MVLASRVTAPVLARHLPSSFAPVLNVIDCIASIVPLNTDVVPNVAEEPTCQKMLEAFAPPLKITFLPGKCGSHLNYKYCICISSRIKRKIARRYFQGRG